MGGEGEVRVKEKMQRQAWPGLERPWKVINELQHFLHADEKMRANAFEDNKIVIPKLLLPGLLCGFRFSTIPFVLVEG